MVKLSSLSLFTRLYLIIAMTVIVSGTLSFFIIDKLKNQTDVDEYVFFTDHIYQILLKQKKIIPNTELEFLDEEINELDGFLTSWQISFSPPPCANCELVGRSGEVNVYINIDEQYLSVYKLPEVDAWLMIRENNIFSFEEELGPTNELLIEEGIFSQYSFDEYTEIGLLLFILVSVVSAIYWPIRVLQRQIENLIKIQHQFGEGDMHARASQKFTKPLNELATSFNAMATSISDTVKENQVFSQAVPHEVRTPLSRIQLAVGLLSQNNNNSQQMQLLGNIDTYIGDINELISQVVAFSKLNAVKDECECSLDRKIALSGFIESRIKALKIEDKLDVIRHINDSLEITTNPAYLRLLVDNLFKNASIYGKNQLIVSLSAFNGHIELSVEDDGDGIPNEDFETIFIPFSRLDVSRNRKTGGLGLGLAISKAACKRMNSKLTVENSPTSGAKFTCHFDNT